MYKLGSFSKNVIICLIGIIQCLFKKSLKCGKFERGGANLNSSGKYMALTMKNILLKNMKIC